MRLAKQLAVDLVFVAPDDPLVLGMVDAMQAAGFATFGPNQAAAIIEGSKAFSKELMKKYHIPTAKYEIFHDADAAIAYIKQENQFPTVIKADGLALGKGVIIAANLEEAEQAVKSMMEDKMFGESGSTVVVEEFLTGPEVSVLSFTRRVKPLFRWCPRWITKRALDQDKGLNTGGMGTVARTRIYKEIADTCMETIFLPTIRAMQAEGRPFQGCLYFGLMLTPNGPKVIEYNCRFGDPETQVVLPLLETDLVDIMRAISEQKLAELPVVWKNGCAACVVMASGGYPKKYETGLAISGLDDGGQVAGCTVYHAGTKLAEDGQQLLTAGGRVLGVTATAENLPTALEKAYAGVAKIHWENVHYRHDIGQRALQALQ